MRCMGVVHECHLRGPVARPPSAVAEMGCRMLFPEAPSEYCWVAETWPEIAPPRMRRGPVIPLAFRNSVFTELWRDRFDLVPNFGLPQFGGLGFESNIRACWTHPDYGPVVASAHCESPADTMPFDHGNVNWWSGWFASPQWLSFFLQGPLRLVRFWRLESSLEQGGDALADTTVEYGLDDITDSLRTSLAQSSGESVDRSRSP
jgi:hypothetical protein